MSRTFSYISKPSTQWQSLLTEVTSTTMYLMSRNGPTVFKIKDDTDTEEDRIYKVTLGNPHKCTCQDSNNAELCKHVLYCLVKVLRVSREHPLCYQTCLTDPELDMVLSGQCCGREGRRRNPLTRPIVVRNIVPKEENSPKRGEAEDISNYVTRQPLLEVTTEEEENTCPICQDNMEKHSQRITWCRRGCGNNFHALCMMKYTEHKQTKEQTVKCPLCRELWDIAILKLDLESSGNSTKDGKKGLDKWAKYKTMRCNQVRCSYCKCWARRLFHRCIECSQQTYQFYQKEILAISQLPLNEMPLQANMKLASKSDPVDFCHDCFQPHRLSATHQTHHFLTSDSSIEFLSEVTWLSCSNPFQTSLLHQQQAASLQALQERDLTVNDYDLLVGLDQAPIATIDISVLLVSALPKTTLGDCWCHRTISFPIMQPNGPNTTSSSSSSVLYEEMLMLPCQHCVHKSCLQQKLEDILNQRYQNPIDTTTNTTHAISSSSSSSSSSDRSAVMLQLMYTRCDHPNCKTVIFGALQRKKRAPPKPSDKSNNSNNNSNNSGSSKLGHGGLRSLSAGPMIPNAADFPLLGIGIGGMGLSMMGITSHLPPILNNTNSTSARLASIHEHHQPVGTLRRNNSVPTIRDHYDQFIIDPASLLNVGVNHLANTSEATALSAQAKPPMGKLRTRTIHAMSEATNRLNRNNRNREAATNSSNAVGGIETEMSFSVSALGHTSSIHNVNEVGLNETSRTRPPLPAISVQQATRTRLNRALQAVDARFEQTPSLEISATSLQSHLTTDSSMPQPIQQQQQVPKQNSSSKHKSKRRIHRINTFRPSAVVNNNSDTEGSDGNDSNANSSNLELSMNVQHYST